MTELQNTPTPHIGAKQGEIAETILLPGDPLRAKYIAEHFLTDAKQFNTTRNMYGYTGYYQGKRVTVMGTGMGCPSMGIYSYELIHFYGCKNLQSVQFKSGKAKFGKQAFAKTDSKMKLKAKKADQETYQKRLKKAGAKNVTVVK